MITTQQARMLGLHSNEKKTLNLLMMTKEGLTATAISEKISIPRTTINFYLKRLAKKGWVKKIVSKDSQYPLWFIKDTNEIKDIMAGFFTFLGITPSVLHTTTIKEGYECVMHAYNKILEAKKTERVYIIQGNRTPSATMENLPAKFIEKFLAVQKQKKIILEGVTSKKALSLFYNMNQKELLSHHHRLAVVYVLPDEYLNFDAEIFVFRNNVIIVQAIVGKSMIIQDENVALALKKIIELIEQYAEKVDINAFISNLIKK